MYDEYYQQVTDKCLLELLSVAQACQHNKRTGVVKRHTTGDNSYTAPAFVEYLNRQLNISDIPMQSFDIELSSRSNPAAVPWDDSIKNLIFDLTSVGKRTFSSCVILTEPGYKYMDATIALLNTRYCRPNSIMILAHVDDEDTDIYHIKIVRGTTINTSLMVMREHLVDAILGVCPSNPLILCHDNSVKEYMELISMLPKSIWSIPSTNTRFIALAKDNAVCRYVCPIYSCLGSYETRAVGDGPIKVYNGRVPRDYQGKLNYYLRCVRGSIYPSTRCYDCEILYRTVSSVYRTPNSSPVKSTNVKFSPTFLRFIDAEENKTG